MSQEKETITYEKLMEAIAETNRAADKRNAEIDKLVKELTANVNKTTANIDSMQKEVGGIGESNGALAEEMVYNALEKDKTFAGIKFDDIERNVKLKLTMLNLEGEYDVVLRNGDALAIIETKYKVKEKDVIKLVNKKLLDFRKLFPMFNDYKIILGIGGMSFEDKAIDEAKKQGIGIIKILGDKVEYNTNNITIY